MGLGRHNHTQKIQETLEEEFISVLNESGYCTILGARQEDNIHIEADLLNYGSGIAAGVAGFIGGLTFCTIPTWATDNYNLTVKITTLQDKQHEYVFDDAMTTVFWLPLIVATPFTFPTSIATKVRKNMYKNLIRRMQEDGLLPLPGKLLQSSRLVLTLKISPIA